MPESFNPSPVDPENDAEKSAKIMRDFVMKSVDDPEVQKDIESVRGFKEAVEKIAARIAAVIKKHPAVSHQFTPEIIQTLAGDIVFSVREKIGNDKITDYDDEMERFYDTKEFTKEEIISQIAIVDDWSPKDLGVSEIIRDKNNKIISVRVMPRAQEKSLALFGKFVMYEFAYPAADDEEPDVKPQYPQIERILFDAREETAEEKFNSGEEPTEIDDLSIDEIYNEGEILVEYRNNAWIKVKE